MDKQDIEARYMHWMGFCLKSLVEGRWFLECQLRRKLSWVSASMNQQSFIPESDPQVFICKIEQLTFCYLVLHHMVWPHRLKNHTSCGQTEKPSNLKNYLRSPQGQRKVILKGIIAPTLRMGNIIIQGIRILYSVILDGWKIKTENEKINDFTEISIISIMIAICLVINILPLVTIVFCEKDEK